MLPNALDFCSQSAVCTGSTVPRQARDALFDRFEDRIAVNPALSRSLVSYQSNRKRRFYRWFKYKEGFSAALVEYFLNQLDVKSGRLLDPFAGSGAAMFAAANVGWNAHGIELMPVGVAAVRARMAAERVDVDEFSHTIKSIVDEQVWLNCDGAVPFKHLRITKDAFSRKVERELSRFRTWVQNNVANSDVRALLELATLNVLESVSYTRKDGQYLRWDERSSRDLNGRPFNKGVIPGFADALKNQLEIMRDDLAPLELFPEANADRGSITIDQGSCLRVLPAIGESCYDAVITSPPYCNRYDYTRTYALELAFLDVNEDGLKALRQDLLSCTVENRPKVEALRLQYQTLGRQEVFENALGAFEEEAALTEVLGILETRKAEGSLNNSNIPRMVTNYFLEMALVIFELARVVKLGGHVVMVNDNVRYAGEEVPVDLILSSFAEAAGFETDRIWTLERGKGNSSQQMGAHGRTELRKCTYVWKKK